MKREIKVEGTSQPDQSLIDLLEQTWPMLENVIGSPAERVHAMWTVKQDERGRALPVLSLSDHTTTSRASASFSTKELQSPTHLRIRFHDLWGDLLQYRLEKIGKELSSILPEGTIQ
jgi:hypothetical protein